MHNERLTTDPRRRRLLKQATVLIGSAAALPGSGILMAQPPASAKTELKVQMLGGDGKTLFLRGPDSNVLVTDSSEGLILVDGGHSDWYAALQDAITTAFPGRPFRALINTHWHPEQTGANLPLGSQDVEIIAHENTWQWLGSEVWQRWSDTTFAPLPAAALPRTLVDGDTRLQLGDRQVALGYLRSAHTDGDLWVYFEDDDVLVTGGLVSNGRWPDIDWWTGGFIGGLLDGFVALLTVPGSSTRIIPAYGDPMNLEELRAQNQMYLNIFDRLHASFIRSESLQDLLAQHPTAEYDAAMGDPTRFLTLAWNSIQGHIRDPQSDRILNIP